MSVLDTVRATYDLHATYHLAQTVAAKVDSPFVRTTYPTEWVWWHKRWRRRPVPNLDLDSRIDYQNNVLQGGEENRHG